MKSKKPLIFGILLCVLILIACFIRPKPITIFKNGEYLLTVQPASFLGKWISGKCELQLEFQADNPVKNTIELADSPVSGPLFIVYNERNKQILCVFDLPDLPPQLIKIDTKKSYSKESGVNFLNEMVFNSSCLVTNGDSEDWRYVWNSLNTSTSIDLKNHLIPSMDLFVWKNYYDPQRLMTFAQLHFGIVQMNQ